MNGGEVIGLFIKGDLKDGDLKFGDFVKVDLVGGDLKFNDDDKILADGDFCFDMDVDNNDGFEYLLVILILLLLVDDNDEAFLSNKSKLILICLG